MPSTFCSCFVKFLPEHLGLPARDPVKLREWYVRVLGARMVYDDQRTPPACLLAMPNGLMIEIYASETAVADTANNKLAGWRHLALQVEFIEGARDFLVQHGVVFSEPIKPAGGGGRVLFFQDPEGNLLHLVERPAVWAAANGTFAQP